MAEELWKKFKEKYFEARATFNQFEAACVYLDVLGPEFLIAKSVDEFLFSFLHTYEEYYLRTQDLNLRRVQNSQEPEALLAYPEYRLGPMGKAAFSSWVYLNLPDFEYATRTRKLRNPEDCALDEAAEWYRLSRGESLEILIFDDVLAVSHAEKPSTLSIKKELLRRAGDPFGPPENASIERDQVENLGCLRAVDLEHLAEAEIEPKNVSLEPLPSIRKRNAEFPDVNSSKRTKHSESNDAEDNEDNTNKDRSKRSDSSDVNSPDDSVADDNSISLFSKEMEKDVSDFLAQKFEKLNAKIKDLRTRLTSMSKLLNEKNEEITTMQSAKDAEIEGQARLILRQEEAANAAAVKIGKMEEEKADLVKEKDAKVAEIKQLNGELRGRDNTINHSKRVSQRAREVHQEDEALFWKILRGEKRARKFEVEKLEKELSENEGILGPLLEAAKTAIEKREGEITEE
ncbi:hypothetical protein K402DRAFT_417859 [Aulographum hederae CBS 113979]|uniref:Uncharacterized protein n=1 Tax=Aulographum hederae CBS 113979 TaxID=1176131 RepID=A0A6G1HBK1_9PEZI|nr:hypothetical protein K402DRAFT_417859 [Aulographum hederae CBS 113979]